MSFTFEPRSPDPDTLQVARVRNHSGDTGDGSPQGGQEGVDYFLSDERILLFLADEADAALENAQVARLAAADALDTLATNEAYVQKVQSTLGESTDGARGAAAIRAHATALRAAVTAARLESAAGGSGTFHVHRRRWSPYRELERRCS
jgi:hypothetical protein